MLCLVQGQITHTRLKLATGFTTRPRSYLASVAMASNSKYAILMAGHTNPQLEDKYGDFGQMTRRLLQDGEQLEEWTLFNTCDGQFPSRDELTDFQGIVVTGSPKDAFSQETNIAELRQLISEAAGNKQKVLGLCFGSQAAAIALGGQAGRAEVGLELGSKLMEPNAAMAQQPFYVPGCDEPFRIHESHQDQITELPPGARLLASSKLTPNEIWAIGNQVLGIQGHPEFSAGFMQALLNWRQDSGTASDRDLQIARAELNEHPVTASDARAVQMMCKAFLKC